MARDCFVGWLRQSPRNDDGGESCKMGSNMVNLCVKATTSDSHSEDSGSNPDGATKYRSRRNSSCYEGLRLFCL